MRKLVERYSTTIKANGINNCYETVRLDVFPDNKAAVGLYLYFGFEYVGKLFFDIKESGYEWYDCYEKRIL